MPSKSISINVSVDTDALMAQIAQSALDTLQSTIALNAEEEQAEVAQAAVEEQAEAVPTEPAYSPPTEPEAPADDPAAFTEPPPLPLDTTYDPALQAAGEQALDEQAVKDLGTDAPLIPEQATCPECGAVMADGVCPECGYTAAKFWGGAVKALGNGKIGGYLVRFSTDEDPDLTGDFFTKETDFGSHTASLVFYQHGRDKKMQRRVLDRAAKMRKDDVGIWVEAQLQMRDEYEKYIEQLARDGKLGWSSGTSPDLVERVPVGKAMWIKFWPLGLDASLTPIPAEPRTRAIVLDGATLMRMHKQLDNLMARATKALEQGVA